MKNYAKDLRNTILVGKAEGNLRLSPAGNSLIGPEGRIAINEIGAQGADVLASKNFPHLFRLTGKALNTAAVQSASMVPTTAGEIYVDFNRGLDTNPGTRALPKKNLSALSGQTFGAGSIIALASDSSWTLPGTQNASGAVDCNNWSGTSGNPLLVTAYDPAGHTGLKPTISMGVSPAAADWTWDAAMNAWLWQPTNTALHPDAGMAVFFGPARLQGTDAFQDPNGRSLPPLFGDLQYAHKTDFGTLNKVWVWAPSTTNPTTYYGGIWMTLVARGAFSTSSLGLSNTIIDGLRFQDTGVGVYVNTGTNGGANAHTGLAIRNCHAERSGLLLVFSSEVAAHSFSVDNNRGKELPSSLVRLAGVGTIAYNIHSNQVHGCNRQVSNMAAFYIQSAAAVLGDAKLHHNYVYDAWNGVGTELNGNGRTGFGAVYDGSAYYFDLGAHNNFAYSNISERCHVAFQTNSAKTVVIHGHIAMDCNVLSTSTDSGLVGNNDVTIAHCTYINRLADNNQLKKGTLSSPSFGICNWFENAAASSIKVYNTALYRAVPVTNQEAIRVDYNATRYLAGNAIHGWLGSASAGIVGAQAVARSYNGASVADITAGSVHFNGSLTPALDGSTWFETSTAIPAANSPLMRAGVRYIDAKKDAAGVAFSTFPTIGAVEYTAM